MKVLLPGTAPRPEGWVTIRRHRDGYLMHTPAWAWRRIEGKTDVAEVVPDGTGQLALPLPQT